MFEFSKPRTLNEFDVNNLLSGMNYTIRYGQVSLTYNRKERMFVLTAPGKRSHFLFDQATSPERLNANWQGYCQTNSGVDMAA